jgi:hypothetical protein
MSITESTEGSFSYGIVCTGAPPAASAKADVEFTSAPVVVTGSGGGSKGGGGALDPWSVLLLGLSVYWRLGCWSLARSRLALNLPDGSPRSRGRL